MSVDTKITEQIRHSQLQTQEIELFKQSFVIVPYQVSGVNDYSNLGYSNKQINPEDYETFKRIWTGNDSATINWKDSMKFTNIKDENGNYKANIEFKLGDVFLGLLETNDSENVVSQDISFSEYTSQEIKKTYTFRVDKKFEITDYYQLMLYKIPELSGSTLFRITNIEKDFVGRNLQGYVLTFETVNQSFANTGSSRQQNIMPNAVGQGYMECIVKNKNWPNELGKETFDNLVDGVDYYKFYDRYITTDFNKLFHNPAVKINVTQQGLGVLSSVACVGRPVYDLQKFNVYEAPRLIFPINLSHRSTPNLFRTQQETTNCYFGEFRPTLRYWNVWKDTVKDMSLAGVSRWNYEGFVEIDYDTMQDTNPLKNGVYEYDIYGKLVKDGNKTKKEDWIFTSQSKEIDTSMVAGCYGRYTIGGKKSLHNHMLDNYFSQKAMKVLPLDTQASVSSGFLNDLFGASVGTLTSLVPGLGGFSEIIQNGLIWGIGTATKWVGKIFPLKYQTFRGIISAPVVDSLVKSIQLSGGKNGILLEMFKTNSDSDNPATLFFNGNTMNTSFQADLTDEIYDIKSGKELNTNNIGQTKLEDGTYILPNKNPWLMDGQQLLLPRKKCAGYIIDQIQINGIFNGEYSVEFLDSDDRVIWNGVFQSAGKWSDSLRDTWTVKNTSIYGRENVYFEKPLAYPEKIEEPLLAIPVGDDLETNLQLFATNMSGSTDIYKDLNFGKNTWKADNILSSGGVDLVKENWSWYAYVKSPAISPKTEIIDIFEYDEVIPNYAKFRIVYESFSLSAIWTAFQYGWKKKIFYSGVGGPGGGASWWDVDDEDIQWEREQWIRRINEFELNKTYTLTFNDVLSKVEYTIFEEDNKLKMKIYYEQANPNKTWSKVFINQDGNYVTTQGVGFPIGNGACNHTWNLKIKFITRK